MNFMLCNFCCMFIQQVNALTNEIDICCSRVESRNMVNDLNGDVKNVEQSVQKAIKSIKVQVSDF